MPSGKTTYPLYAQVYVDIDSSRLDKPFTYGVPEEFKEEIYLGAMVRVPFRNREILGYVSDLTDFPPPLPKKAKLKEILGVIPAKSLWDQEMLELAHWIEKYYCSSFLSALKVVIPAPVRPGKSGKILKSKIRKVLLNPVDDEVLEKMKKRAPVQAKIVEYLAGNTGAVPAADVLTKTGASDSSLKGLEKKGILEIFRDFPEKRYFHPFPSSSGKGFTLTTDQQNALDALLALYREDKARVALLHGITGSGKTEVYLQVIQNVLAEGKEALVLVPEISLTPQAIQRFTDRFEESIAVLHSRLTDAERRQMWWKVKNKKARVVLGARSAIFAPLENIGVIVVDEEHESSYKQDREPRYNARQVAVKRALKHDALVILGSATPSLEVYYWAQAGQYKYISLPNRIGQSRLPEIHVVNLKEDFKEEKDRKGVIGDTLRDEIRNVLEGGRQAILFINRRGFSSFLLCKECGNAPRCNDCDITLTFHKYDRSLKCHYCDYQRPAPDRCPFCKGTKIEPISMGIQRVEEELDVLFPGISIIRMDRDTTSGKDAHYRLLKKFANREASILLGTQMVAKGLDFPGVTLVGVIMADVSLHIPDYRSLERTYQILTQVAGRAGRRDAPGKVVIQTYNPASPVIESVVRQDYNEFFQWETSNREKLNYPPFAHLINLIFTGKNSDRVREYSIVFADILNNRKLKKHFISILGPAPCFLSRIKAKYRWHLLLKGKNVKAMSAVVKAVMKKVTPPSGVNLSVDVDPLSVL